MSRIPQLKTKLCWVLVFVICLTHCQQEFIQATPISNIQKPTLIEANHFYSNKKISVNYNVVHLNQQLPVFIIPKNDDQTRVSYTNRINVTLNDNKGNYISCLLEDNHEICVLEKFSAESLIMNIKCESLPCQFSWNMLQASIEQINTSDLQKSSLKELYSIQQSQQHRHLTIKVSCDNLQFDQQFHNSLQFYANKQNYHRLKTQGLTYYLFKNPPTTFKEYFYIRINEKYRQCAQIQIYNQQHDLKTNALVNDFTLAGQSVNYNLISPSIDMRLDANVHLFSKQQKLSGSINIKLIGSIDGIAHTIRSMSLQPKKKKNIQFSFVLNNIGSHYSNLSLMIESTELDCLLRFKLMQGQVQKVQKGEFSFVSIKRGEEVKYEIIEDKEASNNEKVYIFVSQQHKVNLSARECDTKSGCHFSLVAVQDFDGSLYIGQSKKQDTQQIVKLSIDKSFSKRVPQDTTIYLKKQVQQKKNYQIVVNTHNVILYAAREAICKVPSESCHQRAGNSHNPFIYQSEQKGTLIIAVHALDQTEFTVNIIQQNGEYPELKDGVPFTYLMDENQQDVVFTFNLLQKEHITFNLVAPMNELALYVFQAKQPPTNYQQHPQHYSLDGYVNIKKAKLKSKEEFIVIVRKLDNKQTQFVHFTVIAATKNSNIKLQTGVTHHQKLTPKQHQDFVLQFDSSMNYVISFYLHDSIGQFVNISLQLSKNDTYTGEKSLLFEIDRQVDEIDITEEGKKVCELKGTTSCQVFMRLTNKMGRNVNMQITLLTTNSIVELHDGIWQYFPEQLVSTTTNFYFTPKHTNNPVNIFYNSNNPDMRILYELRKIDSNFLNPEQWQFPNMNKQFNNKQGLNLGMRQVKHISIGRQSLNVCSPNCLLLITLVKSSQIKGKFEEMTRNKQFGILVSNNIIDIPEKTRLEVTNEKGESKYMKMSMKNVFEHDTLTSYVYTSLGFVSVYGNACSDKNMRMPSKDDFDFRFGILQTQLRSETIKRKFQQNDIDEDDNPYLCLVVMSDQSSKFSIEYTSEEEIVSLLRLDEYKTIDLGKGDSKYYQIQGSVESRLKVVRNKGFPFVEYKTCTGVDLSYQQCLEQLQEIQKQTNSQITQKIKRYQYEPCQKCIVYLKIYSEQPAQIDLHLESKYSQITLQEKKITTDFIEKSEENKYQITSLSNEPTFITINVIQGNILCKVSDFNSINLQKQSDYKQRNLHFSITPSQFEQSKSGLNMKKFDAPFDSLFSGFGLQRLFTTLHISIESVDKEKGASYTIEYSSGEREYYLQDGLVSSYKLQGNNQKRVARFYYQNQNQHSQVFLFLGTQKSSQLSKLAISIYTMQSENDQQSKKEINSKIPQLRKKSQKPTVLYPLPQGKFYSIEISNPTGSEIQLSIGVNHQQVIFLPYSVDYPFLMADNQSANFIVDPKTKGYVLLSLKKCDESQGEISYTFDYQGFLNKEYQFTSSLNTDPKSQYLVKIKNPSPLYINIKKNQPDPSYFDTELHNSLFSLNAKFSNDKMNTTDFIKPGNNGQITYEVLSDNKVKIQFYQVTCESKNQQFCTQNFEYFLIASDKMIDVYSQSVCPSTYFADLQNVDKRQILPLRKILEKPSNGKVTLEYKFEKNSPLMYVAVKAVFKNRENEKIEVYYRPIQVASLWGQVQKASSKFGIKIILGVVVILAFCVFLICLRRQKRKGYQTIDGNE